MATAGSSGDPLQLEHVIGYTGRFSNNLMLHHSHETGFVYGLGSNVVLADVTDPHEQIFLRGHSADVSAVDLSASGRLVASGQVKTPSVRTPRETCLPCRFYLRVTYHAVGQRRSSSDCMGYQEPHKALQLRWFDGHRQQRPHKRR
jgi:hypothetical protein